MSSVVFFCDECIPDDLVACALNLEPGLPIYCVGQPGFPQKGTKDPQLLLFAESMGYALVTRDKHTMPGHIGDHLTAGHHTWGIFLIRPDRARTEIGDSLILIWSASTAEEWQDRLVWIPF